MDGRYADSPDPVAIEAATLSGHVVSYEVRSAAPEGAARPLEEPRLTAYITVVALLVLAAACTTAWGAVRSGRGDRRGAARLAAFLAVATALGRVLAAAPFAGTAYDLLDVGVRAARQALFTAGVAWVLYMAVEPLLRRRWPELLVSWTRLLSGRVDALVGRDVLLGCSVGLAHGIVVALTSLHVGELVTENPDLVGTLAAVSAGARMAAGAVTFALVLILILGLAAVVLRRRSVAAVALGAVLLVAYLIALDDGHARLAAAAITVVLVGMLFRFGLLAFAANQFVFLLTLYLPLTTAVTSWRGAPTLVWGAVLAALVGGSLHLATRGRRLPSLG